MENGRHSGGALAGCASAVTVRFLHTADWQIGKPFGRVQEEAKRFRLQRERIETIGRIAAAARSGEAAFVLVAGDLFDSTTVPKDVVLEVLEAIGGFGMPVLVIPGNHDHGGPGTLWHDEDLERQRRRRAPNLTVLLERQPLVMERAVVLACPLLRRHDSTDPTAWICGLDWNALPADRPRLVLTHGGVQGFGGRDYDRDGDSQGDSMNRIDLAALPAAEIDYVALGDWHNLHQAGPRAWYPGTPEPDRFGQGEEERRGQVLLVEAERGGAPRVEVVPTGRLGWHRLTLRLAGDDDLDRLQRLIRERIGERVQSDLLRLEVSGTLSLTGHRRWDALIEELRHQLLHLRLRGRCDQAPGPEELERLVESPDDPLIARVAGELRQRLAAAEQAEAAAEAGDAEAGEGAALARLALCELHRLARRG
jgi:DNA repair exonuclease SbcCD nuclease subunit